jgi:hypothetical protein
MTTTGKRSYENAITSITPPGSTGKCDNHGTSAGKGNQEVKEVAFLLEDAKLGNDTKSSLVPASTLLSQSYAGMIVVPASVGKGETKPMDEKSCLANPVVTLTPPAGNWKTTVPDSNDKTPVHANKTPVPSKGLIYGGSGSKFSNGNGATTCTHTGNIVNPDQHEAARFHWCNDPAFTKLLLDFLIKDLDYKKHVQQCMLEAAEVHRRHYWQTQSILSYVDKLLNDVTVDHPELVSTALHRHHEIKSYWSLIEQNIRYELAKTDQQQIWAKQAVENSAFFFQVLVERLSGLGAPSSYYETSSKAPCTGEDRPSESHRPHDVPSIGLLHNLKATTTSPITANVNVNGNYTTTLTKDDVKRVDLEQTTKKQKLTNDTGDSMTRVATLMPMTPVATGHCEWGAKVTAAASV